MGVKSIFWICAILALSIAQDGPFLQSRQQFAWDLFKNTTMTTNFAISPLSLDYVLNLMFLGSVKKTFLDMKDGLEYPNKYIRSLIELNLQNLTKSIKKMNGVEMATKFYFNNSVQIRKNYQLTIKKVLNSELEKIAFKNFAGSTKKINKWISNSTHNLIKDMIPQGIIDNKTISMLINCIYFGGKWKDPFLKKLTHEGNFTAKDGSSKTVKFMMQDSTFNYSSSVAELKGASAVSLSYFNTSVSMLVVLPPNNTDFNTWLSSIRSINWGAVDNSLKPTSIKLTIPKFNITFSEDMKDVLADMKIQSIFTDGADLDLIYTAQSPRDKLKVGNLLHKVVINVDEVGTVAVGAAVLNIISLSAPMNPPEFTADRPFIFFIRSGPTILFIGQYVG